MSQHWYIKISDRISGPVTTGELRHQAADGQLMPDTLVSLDRQHWVSASRLKGLDFAVSSQINPLSQSARSEDQKASDGRDTMKAPASSDAGSGVGKPWVAANVAGKADETDRPEQVKAKLSGLVASAKALMTKAGAYPRSEKGRALAEQILEKAKEASSRAKKHASKAAQRVREAAVATIPFWQRLFREIREVSIATVGQSTRLVRYGHGVTRMHYLRHMVWKSRLSLGQGLYRSGQGDLDLQNQITVLAERIKSTAIGKGSTRALLREMRGLEIRLASLAISQENVSAVDGAERQQALKCQSAFELQRDYLRTSRAGLAPPGLLDWRRVGIGYGAVICLLFLSWISTIGSLDPKKNETIQVHPDRLGVAQSQEHSGAANKVQSHQGEADLAAIWGRPSHATVPSALSSQQLKTPNAPIHQMKIPGGEDGSDDTAEVFGKDLLGTDPPPSVFGIRMGISPEELNLLIKSKGGIPITENIPYSMAKRAGVERPVEREIRIFQCETKEFLILSYPTG